MKAYINRQLLGQTFFDSSSLTMLGAVIHNFSDPGEYLGTVLKGKEFVKDFHLSVDEKCPAMQVDIDLAALDKDVSENCRCKAEKRFVINPKGYAVFHVSFGAGGYSVRVGKPKGEKEAELFDSARLETGDLLAVTLIRPGVYSVTNTLTKARGKITVAYPKKEYKAYRPLKPVNIECTEQAFKPESISIQAAQGQVYHFQTPSQIKIELLEAEKGPERLRKPKTVGWKKAQVK